jgi:hypothetical protein
LSETGICQLEVPHERAPIDVPKFGTEQDTTTNEAAWALKASVPSSRRRVANQALPKREYSNRESIHKYVS